MMSGVRAMVVFDLQRVGRAGAVGEGLTEGKGAGGGQRRGHQFRNAHENAPVRVAGEAAGAQPIAISARLASEGPFTEAFLAGI